ncbi:porin family protein [Aureibacter tunicatorum]|uniref:Outer membrane protein beta-barrel domain-containing protein n=1 Tax=Aureibacter tunicatorum TaxID=866807 RepID=A0AAE3XNV4_9BACT|nr:porin family protein [Aureibacter tunicatorum]MDR6238534.1 hypothetical protein [Aureibacter tunicatorum]BDD05534.1 hypothetical protein AUTU_30170 [Aureibacter tunicatorum]
MKSKFIIIILLSIISVKLSAQKKVHFGPKIGVNYSIAKIDSELIESKFELGTSLGFFTEFRLSKKIRLQPELVLMYQRYQHSADMYNFVSSLEPFGNDAQIVITSTDQNKKTKSDGIYLQMPIILKYYINENFNLQIGPEIGYILSTGSEGVSTVDMHQSLAYWGNIGVGYQANSGFFIDLRYAHGLNNISKDKVLQSDIHYIDENGNETIINNDQTVPTIAKHLRSFQLSVGWAF